MWDGGKNGQKGGLPNRRALKKARRGPARALKKFAFFSLP